MSEYTNQVLRVVVAQICQTIGWHSIQSTPLELLVDILHKYLQEISRETYRHTELYGRTEPNLVDVSLAFRNLNINLTDIEEYVNYVECVGCSVDVPKYPVRKESNLNFLKPGSKEVLTRPVHIPEYLPPIYPEKEEGQGEIVKKESGPEVTTAGSTPNDAIPVPQNENAIFKKPEISENIAKKPKIFVEDEGRPTREISSVMMTSSGFISPAREGKLPDAKPPIIPEYKSPPLPPPLAAIVPPTLPVGNIDSKFDKKEKKKKSAPSEKEGRKKEKVLKESHKRLAHSADSAEKVQPEKLRPLKKTRNKQKHRGGGDHQMDLAHADASGALETPLEVGSVAARNDPASQQHHHHHHHHHHHVGPHQQGPVPMDLDVKPQKIDELKLSSEPNKEKLNIFKKISTSKKDRDDMSRSPNIFHDSYILSSIPEGTTITPAPPLKHHSSSSSSHHHHHQQQPSSTTASQQHHLDDDPVICVDDEPGFASDIAKNIPVPLPPGTTIKAQTPKKPRRSKQQAALAQPQHLDPNLPINLSSEITASPVVPVNLVKKDIIQNSRLSYPTFPPQKPQKEKKERRKPKAKEPKQKDLLPPPPSALNILPQSSGAGPSSSGSFDEKNLKNFRENAASLFFKKMGGTGKGENILNPGPNPYGGPPNFTNLHAPIPMFPFYAFPPRPGLIPNPGLFPALQPMPDNPAFNKFLPMMRFGNFGNINKGPRLTSTYDDEAPPLPPIDTEKSYCNVAPLVPDSMKFQLSPTRLKSKTAAATSTSSTSAAAAGAGTGASASATATSTSSSSAATSTTLPGIEGGAIGVSEVSSSTSKITKTNFDSPIEISDDENVKSGNEDKEAQGAGHNLNSGDVIMKDASQTTGEGGSGNENILGVDFVDDRNEKSEKRKDKMHKKGKKEKEGKIKKKKDKKDKSKSKDKAEKRKEKEEKKDKERIKKLKKEKKKDKMRARAYSGEESKLEGTNPDSQHSTVPKLTLKIGLGNSPQPDSPDGRKLSIKSHSDDMTDSFDDGKVVSFDRRESSPELARISPLVTRPPKQKSSSKDKKSDSEDCNVTAGGGASATSGGGAQMSSGGPGSLLSGPPPLQPVTRGPGRPPKNPSAAHHHHHHQHGPSSSSSAGGGLGAGGSSLGTGPVSSVGATTSHITSSSGGSGSGVTSTSSSSGTGIQNSSSSGTGANANLTVQTTDAEGNQVWICPACGRVDDGTPMIGCDGCDAWYHWVCVGIQVPPDDNEDWYCRVCIAKKQEAHGADKKRKRKKKNKAN